MVLYTRMQVMEGLVKASVDTALSQCSADVALVWQQQASNAARQKVIISVTV